MNNYDKYLLILFFSLFSFGAKSQNSNCCQYLFEILSIEKISSDLMLHEHKLKTIRIIDKSNFFSERCRCEKGYWEIGVLKEVPVDINTGRSIDFVILSCKKRNKILIIRFFYSLSGQLQEPNLWSGEIKIHKSDSGIKVDSFRIYNIQ